MRDRLACAAAISGTLGEELFCLLVAKALRLIEGGWFGQLNGLTDSDLPEKHSLTLGSHSMPMSSSLIAPLPLLGVRSLMSVLCLGVVAGLSSTPASGQGIRRIDPAGEKARQEAQADAQGEVPNRLLEGLPGVPKGDPGKAEAQAAQEKGPAWEAFLRPVQEPLPADLIALIDLNGDQRITDLEARAGLAALQRKSRRRDLLGRKIQQTLDLNGNKRLEPAEAVLGVARARFQLEELAQRVGQIFGALDADGDAKVRFQEFLKIVNHFPTVVASVVTQLPGIFGRLDADGDKVLTAGEVLLVAESVGRQLQLERLRTQANTAQQAQQLITQILARMDRNRDRELALAETAGPLKENFQFADVDGNSKLDAEEIFAFVTQNPELFPVATPGIKFLPGAEKALNPRRGRRIFPRR